MKISTKAVELLSRERKLILIDRATMITNKLSTNPYYNDIKYRCDAATYIHDNYYKEKLNIREQTIFLLYVLIPDDNKLMYYLEKYDYDYSLISKFYCISANFLKMRHECYKSINDVKIYKKNNS